MYDVNYWQISGTLDPERLESDTQVLVAVEDRIYRAYHTGEDGYLLFLKTADYANASVNVQVYLQTGETCIQALSEELLLPQ